MISFAYRTLSRGGSSGFAGFAAFVGCGTCGACFAGLPFFGFSSFLLIFSISPGRALREAQARQRAASTKDRPYSYSMMLPHFLQARARRPSDRILFAIRVCCLQFLQTMATLETWIGASFSTIPPLMLRCGFGRVCRLII